MAEIVEQLQEREAAQVCADFSILASKPAIVTVEIQVKSGQRQLASAYVLHF